jgi:membrane protease YdiL (CAAX protease family)
VNPLVVAGGVVLAAVGWVVLFDRGRGDIWPRTWVVAAVLGGYAAGALALTGELADAWGPSGPAEVAAGAAVGAAWLVATHVGHAVLARLVPSFVEQVRDLYQLGGAPARRVLGPILAMAAAEELLFRGLVQSQWGLAAAVVVYAGVQVVERNWALVLAAVLGGAVWGALYWWTGSLLAAIVAHAIWTATLTLVWPLREPGGREVIPPADAAPA